MFLIGTIIGYLVIMSSNEFNIFVICFVVIQIASVIGGIMYLSMTEAEFQERYKEYHKKGHNPFDGGEFTWY